ncbi:MAG TPA: hypothetical protein DCL77_14675 [Prolixibacteraceae bacterium]|jgi:hypothetical protein|nr:hypothetical protein [Prolixibacteraceae bacterium]
MKKTNNYCTVRKDQRKENLSVPIGNLYYGGKVKLKYQWINEDQPDEQFQVFYLNQWMNAESADFDF